MITETAKHLTTDGEQLLVTQQVLRNIAANFERAAESALPAQIEHAATRIVAAFRAHGKLLIFGNGGSASDAQHLCGELVVRFQRNRCALPAIALCSDAAVLTACGNDFSFDHVFERQVEALGRRGDVAVGISTSGNSRNVINALRAAREAGLGTILLTGANDCPASTFSDIVLAAPGTTTARIQELHLASYHILCELIETRLFGGNL